MASILLQLLFVLITPKDAAVVALQQTNRSSGRKVHRQQAIIQQTAQKKKNDVESTTNYQEHIFLSRRNVVVILLLAGGNIASTTTTTTTTANAMNENGPVLESKPVSLPSGVTYQDLRQGDGEVVKEGQRVNIQWSLKRSNGYSIDSSAENDGVPFIFVVGSNNEKSVVVVMANNNSGGQRAIAGLDEGIRGMRVGGIRRIVFPPSMAYIEGVEDGKPGPIPVGFGPKQRVRRVMNMENDNIPGESFMLDIKATRVQ